jgi:hypothetical protein
MQGLSYVLDSVEKGAELEVKTFLFSVFVAENKLKKL